MGLGGERRRRRGRNYLPALLLLHGSGNGPAGQVPACRAPPEPGPARPHGPGSPPGCSVPRCPSCPRSGSSFPYGRAQQDGPRRVPGPRARKRRHLGRTRLLPAPPVAGAGDSRARSVPWLPLRFNPAQGTAATATWALERPGVSPALSPLWGHQQRVSPARPLLWEQAGPAPCHNLAPVPSPHQGGDTRPRHALLPVPACLCVLPGHPCHRGATARAHSITQAWGLSPALRIAPGWLWGWPSARRDPRS